MEIHKKLTVKTDRVRLDKFLHSELPDLSRNILQGLVASGGVLVGKTVVLDKSRTVKRGQVIEIRYKSPELHKRADIKLKKIYEDSDVLIIDKPPGLLVHPNPKDQKPSVAAAVLADFASISSVGEDKFRPGIVHRLDADTSGLLIVAKTQIAYEYLKHAFKSRKVHKEYIALVHGQLKKESGKIQTPIGRVPGQGKLSAGTGRIAETEYWVEKVFNEGVDIYSYLRVQLHTGRTHQIRVHFSSIGNPVAGDKLYGGKWKKKDVNIFPRQFLHAHKLRLKLPNGREKEFISPLPEDLARILDKFKR